ncbi:MAG: motility protein A [Lautropia sp.]
MAQTLDHGSLGSLLQPVPFLIVFGGTLGAVLMTYRPRELRDAAVAAGQAFRHADDDTGALAASLVALSLRAHRRGVLVLENELDEVTESFLRDGLALTIDGTPLDTLRDFLGVEKAARDADEEAPARVFETAAGYAPTLGILGAVLGLMRVMDNLAAPSAIGGGIAVAFVATVYGVGAANLVLLPVAGRIRERAARSARRRALIVEALLAMQQRQHPRMVAHKLRSFSSDIPRIDEIALRVAPRAARS